MARTDAQRKANRNWYRNHQEREVLKQRQWREDNPDYGNTFLGIYKP